MDWLPLYIELATADELATFERWRAENNATDDQYADWDRFHAAVCSVCEP